MLSTSGEKEVTGMGSTVEVKKYKSEHEFEKDAEKMMNKGWHIEGQSTRTKKWSLATGFFTNKGITTVTWIKGPVPHSASGAGVPNESGGGSTAATYVRPARQAGQKASKPHPF
jgi:hypothetical protein